MYSTDENGIRWTPRPQGLTPTGMLKPVPADSHVPTIAPWGNAMRIQLDHDAEMARLGLVAMVVL